MAWYVIQTKVQQEFRARENLANQGYLTYLPICQVEKIKRGQLVKETQALFKRYLFIQLDEIQTSWMPIRSTRGVSQLLTWPISKQPIIVKDEIIQCLQNSYANAAEVQLFQTGQLLEIVDGAFKGLQGLFQKLQALSDGEMRAHLLIEFLGKQQSLLVPVAQVKAL